MTLKHLHYIDLPEHVKHGGFDHAAVHRRSGRLYVAHTSNDAIVVIDMFDASTLQRSEVLITEKGAHTIGFDAERHKVYAFLPQTHRAAVCIDQG